MKFTVSTFKNMERNYRNSAFANLLIITLILSIGLSGCKKTDEPDNAELLNGVWINTHYDEIENETDYKSVLEFTGNKVYSSAGVVFDSANQKWINRWAFDYVLSGNRVTITGTDIQENDIEIEFEINSINNAEIVGRFNFYKVNGEQLPDDYVYKYKKVQQNYSEIIVGTWYGRATYAGSADTDYHYWNYLPNGTYEYYYREDPTTQQWIKKNDNEGRYYLYDNLLATNWSNDIFSGNPGLDYECWEIEISENMMKWTGYRANGLVATYEMVKVPGPPVLF